MTAAAKPEIKSDAIYKITIKATGKQCYAVPSDSNPGQFYMTCWDEASASWTCTCRHGEIAAQYGRGASCKHTRAAQDSVLANKANRRRAREDDRNMAELKAEMAREALPTSQKGHLNGSTQGFALLK
jgi:hypothetical protein